MEAIRPYADGLFQRDGDTWRHKRIDVELVVAQTNVEKRSTAGKVGADARWNKPAANGVDAEVEAVRSHPETDTPGNANASENKYDPHLGENAIGNAIASRKNAPSSSPSPRKKDSTSLRSADAEASPEPAEEDQAKPASGADKGADHPPDKPPDQPPPDLKTQLWRDGLATFRLLTKQADGLARKSLGKLLDAAGGDHAALLDAIRQAEITQPDGPMAWLRAAIQVRMAPLFANGSGQ
jgi:hypothetical protein